MAPHPQLAVADAEIRRLRAVLLRIAEEPGSGKEKATIAWAAIRPTQ